MEKLILASEFYYCQEPIIEAIGGVKGKHVLMIPTAALTQGQQLDPKKDTEPFINRGATVNVFDLTGKTRQDLVSEVKKADVIYVRGGNTFCLLEQMNNTAFKEILKKHFKEGTYIGTSAGSIVCSNDISYAKGIDEPSKATLSDYRGLGWVDFNFIPHGQKPHYQDFIQNSYNKADPKLTFVLSDTQALLIENNHIQMLQETP